jgi:6-phosphofructokinase 1
MFFMIKRIGVLTSGGDSPGMNAAIRAVTRSALARGIEVMAIEDGYRGLTEGRMHLMNSKSVSDILFRGGTILGSARLPEFKDPEVMQKGIDQLKTNQVEAIVVIGGDGTYKGALALTQKGINCIGLPGTIDNDLASTEYTIGFDTALNTVIQNIDKLRDTSSSHHRCSVVEVMGNRCGDLAIYSGISCGAELIITPETGYDEPFILEQLKRLDDSRRKKHAIVVITEKIADVEVLASKISKATTFSGRSTVLGHIQRGGSPTAFDRVLATRMGDYAVELLAQGVGGHCVGLVNNKMSSYPILEALELPKPSRKALLALHARLI